MKLDYKKAKIQEKYREKMKRKKIKPKQTLEVIVILFMLVIMVSLIPVVVKDLPYVEDHDIRPVSATDEWLLSLPAIESELKSNPFYKGISFDPNPKPMKIIVRTIINEDERDMESLKGEFLNDVNRIIRYQKLPDLLEENETYEIIIVGKNNKELIRNVYH